jgi:mannose-6-phosphate isomerase-like protein (cupin superfamily)
VEHYAWGEGCDGWHLVRTPGLSVIAERMPAGINEISHYHARAQQYVFVLQGALLLESEGIQHRLRAQEGAHVPAGTPHQARNVSDAPVEFLVISEPPSHGDRQCVE